MLRAYSDSTTTITVAQNATLGLLAEAMSAAVQSASLFLNVPLPSGLQLVRHLVEHLLRHIMIEANVPDSDLPRPVDLREMTLGWPTADLANVFGWLGARVAHTDILTGAKRAREGEPAL